MRNPLRAPAAEGWGPVPETLGREPKECIWEEDGRQSNGKPLSNEISENLAYSQNTKLLQNITLVVLDKLNKKKRYILSSFFLEDETN